MTKLTPTMKEALEAIKEHGRPVIWETYSPAIANRKRIAKQTLDALVRRGYLTKEHRFTTRVPGQRITPTFGRTWRKGYTVITLAYHLTDKAEARP